jgi:hypothetical protein
MYQPDAIDSYKVHGRSYFVTVNEGDAREWPGLEEEVRVSALNLDATAFPGGSALKANASLGRLNVTRTLGDTGNDDDYEALYTLGGRSFTIWDAEGNLVFDSGSQLERLTALENPARFNANHSPLADAVLDNRSDNKGPEPEALAIGRIGDRTYAFIGMERFGGVAAYDISDPHAPLLIDYLNTRSFEGTPEGGDVGPEGLVFIPAHESPTRGPLLAVTSEVSGTVSLYELDTDRGWKRRGHGWSWKRGWRNGRR